jgi:hypothetical protein
MGDNSSFSLSTHRREWIFNDEKTISEQRTSAHLSASLHITNAIERYNARTNGSATNNGVAMRPLPGLNGDGLSSPSILLTTPSSSSATPLTSTLSLLPSSIMSTTGRSVPLSPGHQGGGVGDSPIPFSLAGAMSAAASPAFAATPPSSAPNATLPQSATHAAVMGVAALRMSMSPLSSSLAGTAITDRPHAITLTPDTEGPRPMPVYVNHSTYVLRIIVNR